MQPMYYIGLDSAQENDQLLREGRERWRLRSRLHTGLTFPSRSVDKKRCHNRGTQR
jgi:hypothetical protein